MKFIPHALHFYDDLVWLSEPPDWEHAFVYHAPLASQVRVPLVHRAGWTAAAIWVPHFAEEDPAGAEAFNNTIIEICYLRWKGEG